MCLCFDEKTRVKISRMLVASATTLRNNAASQPLKLAAHGCHATPQRPQPITAAKANQTTVNSSSGHPEIIAVSPPHKLTHEEHAPASLQNGVTITYDFFSFCLSYLSYPSLPSCLCHQLPMQYPSCFDSSSLSDPSCRARLSSPLPTLSLKLGL